MASRLLLWVAANQLGCVVCMAVAVVVHVDTQCWYCIVHLHVQSMAWPPWQPNTSHRNAFHHTQCALHRTESHHNMVHHINALCVSILDVVPYIVHIAHCFIQYSNATYWIASHRIASYRLRIVLPVHRT